MDKSYIEPWTIDYGSIEYLENGRFYLHIIVDKNGNALRIGHGYDPITKKRIGTTIGYIKATDSYLKSIITFTYNSDGKISTMTDPMGRVTTYCGVSNRSLHLKSFS